MGATGHTGGATAEKLLGEGKKLRAIGRSAGKLSGFAARGAEVAAGDFLDAAFLARAFQGAEAVYVMVAPDVRQPDLRAYYNRSADAIAEAVRRSGVSRIVFLSSLGAELDHGTGPIAGLHDAEQKLRTLDVDLLILRPAYFYENFHRSLGLIKSRGVTGGAIDPDVPIAMIATADIGAAAEEELSRGRFKGSSVRELLGPSDYTMTQATRILGAAIGKPDLAYVRFQDADYAAALASAGFSKGVAASFVEMAGALSRGLVRSIQGRTEQTTMSTTFESFAKGLAAAYQAL
ncbi:MAG: NAD(P)H-binding protein [Acidithiobacillales bacterium]